MTLPDTKRLLWGPLAVAAGVLVLATGARAATTEFPLPTAEAFPVGVAAGPDGNLWLTEYSAGRLARVAPDGTVTELAPLPTAHSGPVAITPGPDGALWFTEAAANQIGRVALDGTVTEFGGLSPAYGDPSAVPAGPQSIVAGADGNLWFTEPGASAIGRITPGGAIAEFPLPQGGQPRGIAAGPDGALWFTEYTGNRIGRITTDGTIQEFVLPTPDSRPLGIAAGPDNRLWFTEYGGNRVAAIATDGSISELRPLEQPGSEPVGIAAGPDGALWFTEEGGNRLGRATTDGVVTESPPLPGDHSFPNRITAGPDGSLWFSESSANAIARATLDIPPIVRTGDATGLSSTGGTVTGTLNPSRADTIFWFEYGLSASYGNSTPNQLAAAGDQDVPASAPLGGLPPGTPVHYRLVARNANGQTPGDDRVFATLPESTGLGMGTQPPRLPPVRLSLRAKPRRDRRRPYRFRALGTVVLPPSVAKSAGCRGKVLLWLRRGARTIAAAPARIGRDCRFAGRIAVPRKAGSKGKLGLVARFPGNAALLPRTARTMVRYG
jgi:streptogramin lyase